MKTIVALFVASIVTVSCVRPSAAQFSFNQILLGTPGNILTLQASSAGSGTLILPSNGGTLLTSANAITLQGSTPGTAQTGNINVNGTIIGGPGSFSTLGATGLITGSAGLNLSGTTSPLQIQGSAGTAHQVLTSTGTGNTPKWSTYASASVQDGSGYTSTAYTYVMAGLSSGAPTITPSSTGKVLVTVMGTCTTNNGSGLTLLLSYGQGNGPSAGGTPVGSETPATMETFSSSPTEFSLTTLLTGLTVGQGYWIDLLFSGPTGSSINSILTTAVELP